MTFKKETFIFITSLALILIIGYINIIMSNQDIEQPLYDEEALAERQAEFASEDSYMLSEDDSENVTDITDTSDISTVSGTTEDIDVSFENFKMSKAKNNLEIVDQLEKNISSEILSSETKTKFEGLLLVKNNQIQMENNIEIMLKSKGYNNIAAVVSNNSIKIITNTDIEKADASKILDVVVSESSYNPQQIKIVKFDNKEL